MVSDRSTPYLAVGTETIDTVRVRVSGGQYYPTNYRGIPSGRNPVEGSRYDLRAHPELGDRDTLADPTRRRTGLGVEPMTAAPNAFQTGDGLITLQPGQTHSAEWGIEPRPRGRPRSEER